MKRTALLLAAGWLLAVVFIGSGCGRSTCAPAPAVAESAAPAGFPRAVAGEYSVMTFNLHQYALLDRDGNSDTLEPKPREETEAIINAIQAAAPDILAVQEMGDPAAWAEFKYNLRQAGLDYPHEEYLRRGKSDLNIAVLSRFPIVERQSHTSDTYTIGPAQFPILRGVIDITIEINPDYRLRLMVAHLKSKVFHSFGQAEMRRSEARLLNNHVRDALRENPEVNLLVVGDFNDDPSSAAVREIRTYKRETLLHDLRPTDAVGDAWTHRQNDDVYHRIDFMLASRGLLPEVLPDKCYAVRAPGLERASDHRPIVATFAATERGAESAPDLSARIPPEIPQND
ncbi:MAG: endonuclease/exonuclease/phosphatase family protein [Kiritimatiellia bacterium]|jgi:endonuclease/exonuclease/phosphatase family metal-dependent hydrolase|nr:endonuclease/exonuclease/phosphatase family protein [Kiritimatiellia bacterium]MBP9572659.1 endonuclease/exonuclease/phosphatase family protein [Kiritimatiellia bacterium]HXK79869.1 endonuclease/exonuclease/phosphatase family protein [Kiritimatiellia bacterium]